MSQNFLRYGYILLFTAACWKKSRLSNRETSPKKEAVSYDHTSANVAVIYCVNEKHIKYGEDDKRPHPERPSRVTAIQNRLRAEFGQRLREITMHAYTNDEVLHFLRQVHTDEHLTPLKEAFSKNSAWSVGEASYQAVLDEVRCIMTMCDLLVKGEIDHALLVIRPPGHHCYNTCPAGFCLVNTAMLVAKGILKHGEKLSIFDLDLHHGGGTQKAAEKDERVLYTSIHNDKVWSDGWIEHDNNGQPVNPHGVACDGKVVNLSLPGQSSDHDYLYALDPLVAYSNKFGADIALISAGIDAHKAQNGQHVINDLRHGMCVSSEGYGAMASAIAKKHKKVICLLEGGYVEHALAESFVEITKALWGKTNFSLDSAPLKKKVKRKVDSVRGKL